MQPCIFYGISPHRFCNPFTFASGLSLSSEGTISEHACIYLILLGPTDNPCSAL
jgi:hypothetical protein